MKAIIIKLKDSSITLKIFHDTKTEKRFLKSIFKSSEEFILKSKDSINFIVQIVKCDTCKFILFYEEVDGRRNGKECKIKLGKCINPTIEEWQRKSCICLGENEFCNCIYYKKKED